MLKTFLNSLLMLACLTLVTGVVYPVAVTGIAKVAFSHQAQGSIIRSSDRAMGSELIGQAFTDSKYFWSRPSATTPAYNAGASSGSNQGPTNPALIDAVKARIASLRAADPGNEKIIPIDLIAASASGLDPHISPAAALYQAERVARVRGLTPERVRSLISEHTEARTFGILGEPRINVLLLNTALDNEHSALQTAVR